MEETQTENPNVNIEKLKKDLEEFIGIAKVDSEKIKNLSVSISAKAEEIELYYATYKEVRTSFDDSQNGMRALLDQSTNLKNQVQQISESAQTLLNQVTERTNATDIKVKDIETYHGTFTDLKTKLNDGQTGLQALLTEATNLKAQIEQLNATAQTSLKQITDKLTSITTKTQEIEQYYTATFLPLKTKVDDPKIGIQATLNLATDIKNEIAKTKVSTDERHREIQGLAEKSNELKQNSESSFKEIESLKTKSEDFKNDIAKTFYIVTDTSLANSFKERKDEIKKEVDKWLKYVNRSTIALSVLVILIFISQYFGDIHPGDWRFWYRFAFTSPVILFDFFAAYNYKKERDLLEKYSFKFATSLSLQSYTKLLSDTFSAEKYKDQLIQFSIKSIEAVYREPYFDKDQSQEISGGFKNMFNFGLKNSISKPKEIENSGAVSPKDVSI